MTLWRIRIALWIPKATNTHSEYVILTAFPRQQWLLERTLVLRCTYIVCLVRRALISSFGDMPSFIFSLGNCFFSLISYLTENAVRTQLLGLIVYLTRSIAAWGRLAHARGIISMEITYNVTRYYLSSYFVNNSQCRYKVQMKFFL